MKLIQKKIHLQITINIGGIKFDIGKIDITECGKISKCKEKYTEMKEKLKKYNEIEKLKEILLLCILSLKSFGDKSYEYLSLMFFMIHSIFNGKYTFKVATMDNILLISLLSYITSLNVMYNNYNSISESKPDMKFEIETMINKKRKSISSNFKIIGDDD